MTHTPTPWEFREEDIFKDGELVATAYRMESGGHNEAEANAKFIVKACNAHDDLVSILRAIADNGMDARQCMEAAHAVIAKLEK